jgi:multidrug resistance efflux pump
MQIGRMIRIGLTLAVVGVVVWTVAPYVTNRVSTSAVVNAPLSPIVAPFNGRLAKPSKPVGAPVRPDEPLLVAAAESRDRRHQRALEARETTLQARLAAVARQRDRLEAIAVDLRQRLSRYRTHSIAGLGHEIAETRAALGAARAEAERAAAALARSRDLRAKGLVPQADHDTREADARVARAQVAELKARLDRLNVQRAAAEAGSFVESGAHDVPYSQQRADEVGLRLSDLARTEARLAAELEGVRGQLAEERARRARSETFRPTAPVRGVVWTASRAAGDPIATGQVVLQVADCEQRFVEVAVSESNFETIRAGDIARVQLKGSDRLLRAPVIAVRGAGARQPHDTLAARVPEVERGQLRVLVSLEGVGLDRAPSNFCHIGRTAEVYFARETTGAIATVAAAVSSWATALWHMVDAQLGHLTQVAGPGGPGSEADRTGTTRGRGGEDG